MKPRFLPRKTQTDLLSIRFLLMTLVMVFLSGNALRAQTDSEFDFLNEPEYSLLKTAFDKTDFDITESKRGYYTFFAPTNDAFRALGEEQLKYLFNNPKELVKILRYHFASGKIYAKDLSDGQILKMREGTDAFISLFEGKAFINQAKIIKTDVRTFTGVVHVIDAVITQPTSIVDIVVNSPRHETLEAAVIAAELAGALSAPGTFTLFAPTDDAFAALGQATIDALLADPTGQLAEILKYHVVGATALSSSLSDGDMFTTLEGSDITVTINEDGVFINDAKVIFADYEAPNGVVHIVDAVITKYDGSKGDDDITGIEEMVFERTNLYPNPASDRFNVTFDLASSTEVSVRVFDVAGQMIYNQVAGKLNSGLHTLEISAAEMENGLYLVIIDSESSRFTKKLKIVK